MLPWMSILMGEKALASSRSAKKHYRFKPWRVQEDMSTQPEFSPKSLMASVLASTKSFVGMALLPSDAFGNLILNGSSKGISPTWGVVGDIDGGGVVTLMSPRLGCLGDVATDLDAVAAAASSSGMCKERWSPLAKRDWKPPSTPPECRASFPPPAEVMDAVLLRLAAAVLLLPPDPPPPCMSLYESPTLLLATANTWVASDSSMISSITWTKASQVCTRFRLPSSIV